MTYLVMECHPAYAIVIDNKGRMMKVANLGYEVGQTVAGVIASRRPKACSLLRMAPLAAAACLCLAVLGGGAYGAYRLPYGTVEVRINPDVKMSVSYMNRVVGLEGVNEDGKCLVEGVVYKSQTSEHMTGLLVKRAVELGYLSDGGDIYVTADSESSRWKEKRENAIRAGLDHLLGDEMQVTVHLVDGAGEDAAAPISPPTAPPSSLPTAPPASPSITPPSSPPTLPSTASPALPLTPLPALPLIIPSPTSPSGHDVGGTGGDAVAEPAFTEQPPRHKGQNEAGGWDENDGDDRADADKDSRDDQGEDDRDDADEDSRDDQGEDDQDEVNEDGRDDVGEDSQGDVDEDDWTGGDEDSRADRDDGDGEDSDDD